MRPSEMTLRVHRDLEHPNNSEASFNPLIEHHAPLALLAGGTAIGCKAASVREPIVAGAYVLDQTSRCGHFSELFKTTLKPKEVVVSFTFAEPTMRIDVDFGQIPVCDRRKLKLGHYRLWISRRR